jgi:hypothetical protein
MICILIKILFFIFILRIDIGLVFKWSSERKLNNYGFHEVPHWVTGENIMRAWTDKILNNIYKYKISNRTLVLTKIFEEIKDLFAYNPKQFR